MSIKFSDLPVGRRFKKKDGASEYIKLPIYGSSTTGEDYNAIRLNALLIENAHELIKREEEVIPITDQEH